MKKKNSLLTALMLIVCLCIPAGMRAADDEEPIITLYSNSRTSGATGFGISLGTVSTTEYYDIDFGFGKEEVEVQPWEVKDGAISSTYIACSPTDVVKIYGDASKLSFLDASGAYLNSIDISKCTNLEVLYLEHNEFTSLDLTPLTNLYALYLSDNPFTPQNPLIVGAPKNGLEVLEMANIDHVHPDFNISDYPKLKVFDAYHSVNIKNIDPSGCKDLMLLSMEMTSISSIDLSQNINLQSLNISETQVSHLDVSKNINLNSLYCGHYSGTINTGYHLDGIDVSNNPKLAILDMAGNKLKSIDVSKNPLLHSLFLTDNDLTALDVSNNENIFALLLNNNNMDFATLPQPRSTFSEYFYFQKPLPIGVRSVAKGAVIDLSKRVLRPGSETTAKVFRKPYNAEPSELDAADYTYADGKVTINVAPTDSLYVEYFNSVLNEYSLKTTPFLVKDPSQMGQPSEILSFTAADNFAGNFKASIGLAGATATAPRTFYVEINGSRKTCTAVSAQAGATANVDFPVQAGAVVKVLVPENDVLTALSIDNVPLADIDITKATEMQTLAVTNCGLKQINLLYNRCLTDLDLSHNKLTNVDLKAIFGNYEKNTLKRINASDNELVEFYILARGCVNELNLSNNRLEQYNLKDFDNIDVLDLSGNLIAGDLNLAYQANASKIDVSDNKITGILFDAFNRLEYLDLSGNKFTLQNLPYLPEVKDYVYAPMQPLEIRRNAPAVNLSDQNRIINGRGTTYVWKKADGTALVQGVDVDCTADGAARFLKQDLGKVYCEMTNPAFPQFAGGNIYKTTLVNVVGAPSTVVASFTTLKDSNTGSLVLRGDHKTELYIDWRGDGSEYIPYDVSADTYVEYSAQRTFANADVKVYTYEQPTDITVFSLGGMPMAKADLSPLTKAFAIAVTDAGLDPETLILPDADLTELKLNGNNFSEFPYADKYPNLQLLNLNENKFTTFNAGKLKALTGLYMTYNELTSIEFDNPTLWEVDLSFNQLENIDFTKAKAISQLSLANNRFSTIDIMPIGRSIVALSLVGNRFTFATLPVKARFPRLMVYFYSNQEPIEPVISNNGMTFDLSSQAMISSNATAYTWFLGDAVFDRETGTLYGETLIEGDEYTIENGITTFTTTFFDRVMCVMTNPLFPDAFMYTRLYSVGSAGVELIPEATPENTLVDVYNLQGVAVRRQVERANALEGLQKGIYIVNGMKILVK